MENTPQNRVVGRPRKDGSDDRTDAKTARTHFNRLGLIVHDDTVSRNEVDVKSSSKDLVYLSGNIGHLE